MALKNIGKLFLNLVVISTCYGSALTTRLLGEGDEEVVSSAAPSAVLLEDVKPSTKRSLCERLFGKKDNPPQKTAPRRLIVSKEEMIIHPDGRIELPPGAIGVDDSWSEPSRPPDAEIWIQVAHYFNDGHFRATGKRDKWVEMPPEEQLFYYGLYEWGQFEAFLLSKESRCLPRAMREIDGWIVGLKYDRRGDLHSLITELNNPLNQERHIEEGPSPDRK